MYQSGAKISANVASEINSIPNSCVAAEPKKLQEIFKDFQVLNERLGISVAIVKQGLNSIDTIAEGAEAKEHTPDRNRENSFVGAMTDLYFETKENIIKLEILVNKLQELV